MDKRKLKKILNSIVALTVLLVLITLGISLQNEKEYTNNINQLEQINIIGAYRIEGKEESYTLPKDGNLELEGNNKVIIEGNFNKEIPINTQLLLRIDNMKVKIFINGEEFYSFGEDNTFLSNAKSPGNLWDSTVSTGIKTTDKIKIELYNVYTNHVETTFSTFLNNIYTGYESTLILDNMYQKPLSSFVYIFIVSLGFLSIGLACIMIRIKEHSIKLLYFGGLCISSGIWCFIDFNIQNYYFPYPVFNNSLDMISLLFSMFFLIMYFAMYLKSKCKYILFTLSGTFIVAIIVMTILQFLGISDYYEILFYIQSTCIVYTPIIVGCIFYEKKKLENRELDKLLFPTIILAAGVMGDAICNMFEIIPYIIWFRISYLIFIVIQFIHITKIIRNALLESAKIQILEEQAYQDGLTGVGNRTAYMKKVDSVNNNLNELDFIEVFVFDINNLKIVNDTLGHEYGDYLIKRSGDILLSAFDNDSIYRIGGDEFVVIKENKNETSSIELIKKFEDEIKNSNDYFIDKPPVSMAYGVAVYDDFKDTSFEDIFARADKEMYANKIKMKEVSHLINIST
ncbi:MAG: diguanylate cyclase [Peptostreptococcaceae bacterium]